MVTGKGPIVAVILRMSPRTRVFVLFGEVAEPLGSGALLEEVGHWEAGLEIYSLIPIPSPSLLLDLLRCEEAASHFSCRS